jgi:AraC family transcriptional activator of pobA
MYSPLDHGGCAGNADFDQNIALSAHGFILGKMNVRAEISQYHLYGDDFGRYAPDLVHIETIAARASLHNWIIAPHRHPSILQFLLMESGRGVLTADGEEIELPLPSLVMIPTGCPHAFRFADDAVGAVLSLSDALLEDRRIAGHGAKRFVQGGRVLVLALGEDPARARLIAMLLGEVRRRMALTGAQIDDGLCATLVLLFSLAEETAQGAADRHDGTQSPRIELARRFFRQVELNFCENWSVGDFADTLGCSQATLTRACREVTGKSPAQLVIERRILEAKRALSFTNASVSQIAGELGYTDPAYFARQFRENAGMTARAYRQHNTRPVPELVR